MKNLIFYLVTFLAIFHNPTKGICQTNRQEETGCTPEYRFDGKKLHLAEEQWKKRLTPEQFKILRKKGTEPPFKNAYYDNKEPGIYVCAACALPVFSSKTKYDSGTGWPSFWAPICPENVEVRKSFNPFSSKREVVCSRCNSHLGDVFDDGPPPTGKRYCMNSVALKFVAKESN